jgi:predicted DNA-binding transcriptional regulator YafY
MDSVLLEPVAPPPTGCRVRIQYIDASWRRTERVIEPLRTFRSRLGETYLEAFCHLRGERRTFRLDRITSWVVEDVQERVSARSPAEQVAGRSPTAACSLERCYLEALPAAQQRLLLPRILHGPQQLTPPSSRPKHRSRGTGDGS